MIIYDRTYFVNLLAAHFLWLLFILFICVISLTHI
jgi:hypothetical protein